MKYSDAHYSYLLFIFIFVENFVYIKEKYFLKYFASFQFSVVKTWAKAISSHYSEDP